MSSAVFTVISFSVVILRRFRRMPMILSTIYSFSAVWTLFLLSDILDLLRIYWKKMIFTIFFLLYLNDSFFFLDLRRYSLRGGTYVIRALSTDKRRLTGTPSPFAIGRRTLFVILVLSATASGSYPARLYVKNSYSRYLFDVGSQSRTVLHSTIPGRVKVWRENHIYTFYVYTQNIRVIYMTLSWVHGITVRVRTLSAVPVNDDGRTMTTIALALFNNAVD